MKIDIDTRVELNNRTLMPVFGLGVWQMEAGQETMDAVLHALDTGYRLVDTAQMYGNEVQVGEAVRRASVPREDVFVTTKVWNDDHGYEEALEAFDESMGRLGLDYVDLYLIHWPVEGKRMDTWRALEEIYDEGRAKAIGVSNYTIRHLREVLEKGDVRPTVNQVEFHPFLYQRDLLEFCMGEDVMLQAYSPLTKGRRLDDPRIADIARKYSKSNAQIMIRWGLQHGVLEIPKSSDPEHIDENAEVFDFTISDEDMAVLDGLNEDSRVTWDPSNIP